MSEFCAPRAGRVTSGALLFPALLGGFMVSGCYRPPDEGDDSSPGTTDTDTSPPPDGTLNGLAGTISDRVPTVVNVTWDGSEVSGETFVEYGLDGALDHSTRPGTAPAATLLGLKAGRTYSYRAVTLPTAGGRWESEVATVDLDAPPSGLPVFTIEDFDEGLAHPGGFFLTSLLQEGNSWTIIIDRDGDYVWYLPAADGLSIPTSHVTRDQHGLLFTQNDRKQKSALGGIVTVPFDASSYTVTAVPLAHHDATDLPNGDIAFISLDTRDNVRLEDGQTMTVTTDTIGVAPEGATEENQSTILYDYFDDYPHQPWYVCNHFGEDAYNTGGKDWTHSNSIMYDEDQDAFMLVSKNFDAMLKIDAGTGEVLWQLGGRYGDFTDVDGDRVDADQPYLVDGPNMTWWSHGHMSHWWPGGFVMFDNGYHHDPAHSRAVEYAYDETAMTVEKVWEFWAEDNTFNPLLGDVRKLDNGNYLVSWTSQGMLTEITPSQEVVWRALSSLGAATGRVNYIPDMYGG